MIDIVARDVPDLVRQLEGRAIERAGNRPITLRLAGARIEPRGMGAVEKLLGVVSHPNVAYVLFLLGLVGLYFELSSPGAILPGVVGGIALLLAFYAFSVLPVNLAGIFLILFGIGLFVAEVKVVSHGLLAVGGAVALVAGSLLLFTGRGGESRYRVDLGILAPSLALVLVIVALLTARTIRLRRLPATTGAAGNDRRDGAGRGGLRERERPGARVWRVLGRPGLERPAAGRPRSDRRDRGADASCRTEDVMGATFPGLLIAVFIFLLLLFKWINVLKEYERAVTFWLGRLSREAKGPGLVLIFWPLETMVRISMRTVVHDVPTQDIITRDNVSVKVNAVVYFRVVDPNKAVVQVENYLYATSQLAQTTLRSILGQALLDELLSEREKLNVALQKVIDEHTSPWGVKVSLVEVKQVDLPPEMQRAMARQAEAERERRAKVIHASGEFEAAAKLSEAAEIIGRQPATLQLRYLQTLTEIANEKNSTIIFPAADRAAQELHRQMKTGQAAGSE